MQKSKEVKCSRCQRLFKRNEVIIYSSRGKLNYFHCRVCNSNRIKKYRETQDGKLAVRKTVSKYNKQHPHKVKAWDMAKTIPISPCEVCGSLENIRRHHDDYKKPKGVKMLCAVHHTARHRYLKARGKNP